MRSFLTDMKIKQIISDFSLFIAIIILGYYFNEEIIIPANSDYEFVTVTKFSDFYEKPIFLSFHWAVEEQLQVGKLVSIWAEIRDMPHTEDNPPQEKIQLKFNEDQLNFWTNDTDNKNNGISYIDTLTFKPDWKTNVLRSNEIDVRFIVPVDISAELCDENIPKCMEIKNIIHPAPYDLSAQLESNRISSALSLIVVGLSFVIIWATLRPKSIATNKS